MNANRFLLGFLFILLISSTLSAQSNLNWKKHQKLAQELFAKAQYFDAAEHYKAAWKQKSNKKELIYKAGECYYIIKDYSNAAKAFENVKEDYSNYPLVGLKYARSLKQSGDYDTASRELVYFLNNYKGADKAIISSIVQNEIRGCELGIKLSASPDEEIEIQHLGSNINTPETEFAPYAYNDETLYYSSTMAARAEIYRSRKVNGEWTRPEKPEGFPKIENDHFCNGNLSPDGNRFYFTVCKSKESWGGLTTECDIFVTKRIKNAWSTPERLRDYVNIEGTTTTHPFVIHQNNTEILYFSSNREGGQGGMDIWYMSRDLKSNDIDFTFPINCGSTINTKGDEISPFYDQEEGNLYMASNGLVTIGGYDIFYVKGSKSQWETPENIGTPINSSADDFFFVRTPSRKGGFFVSNRTYGAEKISTLDEDIFSFSDIDATPKVSVKGKVLDKKNQEELKNIIVSLSKYTTGGNKQFIANKRFEDGNYSFSVLPGAEYEMEVQLQGYIPQKYVFSTREEGLTTAGKTLYMERMRDDLDALATTIPQEKETKKITPKVNTSPKKEEKIVAVNTPQKKEEPTVTFPTDTKAVVENKNSMPVVTKIEKEEITTTTSEVITTATTESAQKEVVGVTTMEKENDVNSGIVSSITFPTTSTQADKEAVKETTSSTTWNSNTGTVNEENSTTNSTNSSTSNTERTYVSNNTPTTTSTSSPTYTTTATTSPAYTTSNGVRSSAPRHEGVYYKIQIIAVSNQDSSHTRYDKVRDLARMDTEYIIEKGLTRVLLADFFSYSEAKEVLLDVKRKGFERAYLVKYSSGERVGRVQ